MSELKIENGQVVDPANPHLGGYVPGPLGDPATYYPELWVWLVENLGVKSVIDVGAGAGVAVEFFGALLGTDKVMGVEGIPQQNPRIYQHDFTKGPWFKEGVDLVWCCETLEHIEERFLPNVLYTFTDARYVLLTHAEPGQGGHHHVNCQNAHYWIGAMAAIGYQYDTFLTAETRDLAARNTNSYNHFVRSGMAFRRYQYQWDRPEHPEGYIDNVIHSSRMRIPGA